MPKKGGVLTPQERVFVDRFAATGDGVYAAEKAGYKHPAQRAHDALQRPAIQSEVLKRANAQLLGEGLPLAVQRHIGLLQDARTPGNVLVNAIKLMYERTLGTQDASGGKEPHEMTGEELALAISALKREASERARPIIDAEPSTKEEQASVFE